VNACGLKTNNKKLFFYL